MCSAAHGWRAGAGSYPRRPVGCTRRQNGTRNHTQPKRLWHEPPFELLYCNSTHGPHTQDKRGADARPGGAGRGGRHVGEAARAAARPVEHPHAHRRRHAVCRSGAGDARPRGERGCRRGVARSADGGVHDHHRAQRAPSTASRRRRARDLVSGDREPGRGAAESAGNRAGARAGSGPAIGNPDRVRGAGRRSGDGAGVRRHLRKDGSAGRHDGGLCRSDLRHHGGRTDRRLHRRMADPAAQAEIRRRRGGANCRRAARKRARC